MPVARARTSATSATGEGEREVGRDTVTAARGGTEVVGQPLGDPPFDAARVDGDDLGREGFGRWPAKHVGQRIDERVGAVGVVDVQHGDPRMSTGGVGTSRAVRSLPATRDSHARRVRLASWYRSGTVGRMAMNLRTDDELDRALGALAETEGISRHEVIRRAVLERYERAGHSLRVTDATDQMLERWGDVLERLGTV